ncbi:Predicted O-methyltransferase YrrM [Halobacillus karajensis]|uniref:tRNA 5-hydroxyuridine methyltransferase n=1 Tax=Halobacillus karajensis TaxID=195088 RepID=A0A024P6C3_9BACI|nr:O-methyltransferase [Halobacillus karajensis]CDQ18084.1 protein-L-isoaspartate O-methyltransferase [Halobacillus karajensis]CDQ24435.1 protein-L-isoaspartate O-methyltransferase [Halobacillus karajensis]CDQ29317.1 protein-L-isoaspartate O-methyltransferase [Halobacillus karajensis]SEH59590.1 Predicted O-methyltransferase YrrM [Halobacillus karajensis]
MKQEDYLQSLLSEPSTAVREMESYAKEQRVPIMEPLGIEFLMQLLRIHQPKNILEIGTAIGYSALRMLEACPGSNITTVERDENRYNDALQNIKAMNVEDSIHVIHGDALDVASQIEKNGPFDLLFIDAAKGKYEEFFHLYSPMISKEGLIISDNVLFKGFVADDSEANPRMAKIARKIRKFNEWLVHNPDYHTTIVPIGDGVAITKRKQ